jgi:hypothetical protein
LFFRFYDVGGKRGDLDLVITSDMKTFTVGVIDEKDMSHNPDLILNFCQLIFDFLKETLNGMRSSFPWMKNMEFEFGIRCPICCQSSIPCSSHKVSGCIRDACVHFVPENELPRCYNNPTNPNTLIQEEAYSHWFPEETENASCSTFLNILLFMSLYYVYSYFDNNL